ncbi:MAG: CbiQ family ECF transporter T component, partial [Treponema sp.]|nr:CbiQ family ECF transporter T component [Treponema sp.]
MKHRPTPWAYRKGSTALHRLPAGFKLGFLLALSLAAFFPGSQDQSLAALAAIWLVLIVLSCIARIPPAALLRGSSPILFLVLAVFLFRGIELSPLGFNIAGLWESVIFCLRICAAFAAG